MSKYEYIDSQKTEPENTNPVWRMCLWLAVSTSGFYDWLQRPQSATAARREALTARVRHFFTASDGTYGYRRIHADLTDEGTRCSPELVRQIMRSEGLVACQPRPFRITTDGDDTANLPDLVQRKFTADRPGVKFVGDITYMHTWQGFIYLATVIDCYSKRVGALPIFRLTARSPTSLSPAIRLRQQHERGFDLAWSSLGYHAARDSQG